MQAITTKFNGPTNTRGSRIKATAERGTVTVPYDHSLSSHENHIAAAQALATKFISQDLAKRPAPQHFDNPWSLPRVVASLPSVGCVHVFTTSNR